MMQIPTGHVSSEFIATEAFPNLHLHQQQGNASQLEAMSHIPRTVLMPPGQKCAAIYNNPRCKSNKKYSVVNYT